MEYLALLSVLWFVPTAFAQIESALFDTFEAAGDEPFSSNPASFTPETFSISLLAYNQRNAIAYTDSQDNQDYNTNAKQANLAANLMSNLGSGLYVGLIYSYSLSEDESKEEGSRQSLSEEITSRYTGIKAAVEILEKTYFGFLLRFLDQQTSLYGNINLNINQSQSTTFRPSLFGSAMGVTTHLEKADFAASYAPAMKGKADVFGEEKIVTTPGYSLLNVTFHQQRTLYGFYFKRPIYKHNDLSNGSTLADNNNTRINLLGLNPYRSKVFPTSEYGFGMMIPIGPTTTLGTSLNRQDLRFLLSNDHLPGEQPEDPRIVSYFAKVSGRSVHGKLVINVYLAANLGQQNTKFTNDQRVVSLKSLPLASGFAIGTLL